MGKKKEYNWTHEEWVDSRRHGSKVANRYERALIWKAIKEDLPFWLFKQLPGILIGIYTTHAYYGI